MRCVPPERRRWVPPTVAGLLAMLASIPASAEPEPLRWRAELPVFLTATLYRQSADGVRERRVVPSILAEWRFRHGDRPWSIGPVIEVHRTVNGGNDTAVSSGVIVRHDHRRWDTTALVYRHLPRQAANTWNYGARLRFRVSPAGKMGAEAYGLVDRMDSSDLWFGYYGDVTRNLSFRLLAGTDVDQRETRLFRVDLVLALN